MKIRNAFVRVAWLACLSMLAAALFGQAIAFAAGSEVEVFDIFGKCGIWVFDDDDVVEPPDPEEPRIRVGGTALLGDGSDMPKKPKGYCDDARNCKRRRYCHELDFDENLGKWKAVCECRNE